MTFRSALIASLAALAVVLSGCAQPGAPLPPSLHLPAPVKDLTAARVGETVTFHWTMPKNSTDKLPLSGPQTAEIWLDAAGIPHRIASASFAPGAPAVFTYTLPPQSTPEIQSWSVRLLNSSDRDAGPSNEARTFGGPPVPVPANISVTSTAAGVRLNWQSLPALSNESILVHRVLITPPPANQMHQNNSAADSNSNDLYLTVPSDLGQALDTTALWNAQYSYSIQHVVHARASTDPKDSPNIETRSTPTPLISVFTRDIYPPAKPTGLAVVLSTNNVAGVASISVDLSWLPNSEPDLAGYILYRRTSPAGILARITSIPVTVPGFSDSTITPGSVYDFCVSAVDTSGNESPCSAEESISVPTP